MIEVLMVYLCITPGGTPCDRMSQAYYQEHHIQDNVDKFVKDYPELAYTIAMIGTSANRNLSFPVYRNWVVELNGRELQERIYMRWEWGF